MKPPTPPTPPSYLTITQRVSILASPIVVTALVRELADLSTIVFVGRTGGADYIGAATLGNMMCNITGYSLAHGLCSALDTYISQAYGAKQYRDTGVHAQRAAAILSVFAVPVAFLWFQTAFILEHALRIPRGTAMLAGEWGRCMVLGLWPQLMAAVLQKWLQNQGVVYPVVWASIGAFVVNVTCNYLSLTRYHYGFRGVAVVAALTQWSGFFCLLAVILARKAVIRRRRRLRGVTTAADCFTARASTSRVDSALALATRRLQRLRDKLSNAHTDTNGYDRVLDSSNHVELSIADVARDEDSDDEEIQRVAEEMGTTADSDDVAPPPAPASSPAPAEFYSNFFAAVDDDDDEDNNNDGPPSDKNSVASTAQTSGRSSVADTQQTAAPPTSTLKLLHQLKFDADGGDMEDNWPVFECATVFSGWGEFLRLGLPGAVSLLIEWGSFELAAGIAAQLGPVPLAVHGVYMSTANIFYMMPQAVALATATLTGNALGALQPREAAQIVNVGIVLDFLYGALAGALLLFVLRPFWGSIFTVDAEVMAMTFSCMPIMFIYLFVDSTKCVTLTILRSTGRPTITVVGNTFACLVIMLPLGWWLALRDGQGIIGLWLAMSVAWFVATVLYLVTVYRTDWKTQIIVKPDVDSSGMKDDDDEGDVEIVFATAHTG